MIDEVCRELLFEGRKPAEIAKTLGLSTKAVYRILKRETADYEPAARVSEVWRSARATVVRLLVRLGFQNDELASRFNVHPSTISRWRHARPGGVPLVQIEVLHDCTLPTGELLPNGIYRVFDCSNRQVICLRDEKQSRLYFLPPHSIRGNVRLCEEWKDHAQVQQD